IKNTLAGDANLDGIVNFADLLVVAQNFNHTLDTHGNAIDWADGDFNYDGKVNFADLLLVAQNFNKHLAAGQAAQTPLSSGPPVLAATETATPAPEVAPSPVTVDAGVVDAIPSAPNSTANMGPSATTPSTAASNPATSTAAIATNFAASSPVPSAVTPPPAAAERLPPTPATDVQPGRAALTTQVLDAISSAPWIPTELTGSPTVRVANVVAANASQVKTTRALSATLTGGIGNVSEADNANIRPAKARLVIAAPPVLPTDGITDDALSGVWSAESPADDLLFPDSRDCDRLTSAI
ncbi:MAG: dockerin type I domain-containing protein, partial [Tepidisphaeraceae bacterium]